jgi:hypothetical protein
VLLERPFLLGVIPFSFVAAAFIFAGLLITPTYAPEFRPEDQMEVARVTVNDGRVDISRYHTYQSSRLRKGTGLDIPVFHMDKITTQARSSTKLVFLDGYEIQFLSYSQFVIEAWDLENKRGPLYINMLSGDYRLLKKGQAGTVYIVKDNKIFLPSQKPKLEPRRLISYSDKNMAATQASLGRSLPSLGPRDTAVRADKATKDQGKKQTKGDKEQPTRTALNTLSNEYIDKVIARNADQLKKCQTFAIRENKNAKGEILLGLAIAPRGKMEEVTVMKSSLENEDFEECVTSVFKRTRFKSFDGKQIVRTYPVIFN